MPYLPFCPDSTAYSLVIYHQIHPYGMKPSDLRKITITISLYVCYTCLLLGLMSFFISISGEPVQAAQERQAASEISIHTNNFDPAHQISKPESIELPSTQRIQSVKLIRNNLFDTASIELLTNNLIFFVGPLYLHLLSPLWRPSISIAQRRLLI